MTAATPGQAAREALEATFRRTYALHPNDFRAKFEQARNAVMGAADAYAQAVAQADLLSRLRTVLLDLRTQPVEARIQALHLLDTAASPPAGVQSAPDDALFWAWMDAYVDEPHNAQYEVPDMQRAFEGGMEAARDQAAIAAQDARPAPEWPKVLGHPDDAAEEWLAETYEPDDSATGVSYERSDMIDAYHAGSDWAREQIAKFGKDENGRWRTLEPKPAPGLAALRELLDEIGVMAANAPEDGDSFGLLEEIAMRIAAAGVEGK